MEKIGGVNKSVKQKKEGLQSLNEFYQGQYLTE